MKVIIDIPKNKLNGIVAFVNMEGKLSEEQVQEILDTPKVDITEVLKSDKEASRMLLALGMIAVGVVSEQKFPDL